VATMVIFDDDLVEPHNVAASYYTLQQAQDRMPKAEAVVQNLTALMPVNVLGVKTKITSNLHLLNKPIMIISTDNKESRLRIWRLLENDMPEFIIDARSGWDVTRIYTCQRSNEESRHLYDRSFSGEGQDVPCSARAVAYNSMGVAAKVSAIVKSYVTGGIVPTHVTDDFKTWVNITQHS